MFFIDHRTADAAGAFLEGELERFDPTLNEPLSQVTWQRDIQLREDVQITDEAVSFARTDFVATGVAGKGKSLSTGSATAVAGVDVSTKKETGGLWGWEMQIGWDIIELQAALRLKRPIDDQKLTGLITKHQFDTDEMVYIGDTGLGVTGLLNNPGIAPFAFGCDWVTASAEEILAEVNRFITHAWQRTGGVVAPTRLLLPQKHYAAMVLPVTPHAERTVLDYVSKSSLAAQVNGKPLEIFPAKFCAGAGTGGLNRAVLYTKDKKYVRFPFVGLQRTPVESRGMHQLVTYYGKFGGVEFVYPETVSYGDLK